MKVARELGRNSWCYEVDVELKNVIKEKLSVTNGHSDSKVDFFTRGDARRLRTSILKRLKNQVSVTKG